ncbi:hypothetical protein DSL72_004742 [Monilinia vaccinii-corymbosi]|uniref:Calcofluor white hypersensitive protein n=1 Tax=Monilinia vaccinii-corymbosi TaxID=61207 RepID=A0A8A3P1A9_9HELO|nr:hypothetical protein DSL72_004742 [Monilinia vaccinii-corymbosi]
MPGYSQRYATDQSTSSRDSRRSDESSQGSQSTAPTSIYSSPRPSIHQYQPDRPIYHQKKERDMSPCDSSPAATYLPRSSQETYDSTLSSQEDIFDEPESYDPEYEVPEYTEVVEKTLRPSNAQDFARFFPSTKRLYIRHDDTSYDGNMNLRVDTEVGHGLEKEVIQLFHLRMQDLKNREFSLRRYERSSGREVCHSSRKYVKPAERRPSVLTRSVSNALAHMRKHSPSRTDSPTSNRKPIGGTTRHDSGYASASDSDSDFEAFMASKKASAAASMIPTNTTKLEFSNYAQVDVKRRGARGSKRYEFEYWGRSYSWKRVSEKDGDGKAISYHLFKGDSSTAIAHIVPELRSRDEMRAEDLAGGWIPPCQVWISDPSVLHAVTDVADVIISTGLVALVDDSIKRRFQPKRHNTQHPKTHSSHSSPYSPHPHPKMDNMDFVNPKALVSNIFFKRRDSRGSHKSTEEEKKHSPLRYCAAQPVVGSTTHTRKY